MNSRVGFIVLFLNGFKLLSTVVFTDKYVIQSFVELKKKTKP